MDARFPRAPLARVVLAMLASAGLSTAWAHDAAAPVPGHNDAPAAAAANAPVAAGGLVIFKDPASGQWRDPDPAEIRALVPQARATRVITERALPSGGYAVMLDSSFDSFMVMTRADDGLAYRCVTPLELAAELAPAVARTSPAQPAAPVVRSFRELPDVQ